MIKLDQQYWQERYTNNSIGWDLGKVSTPLKNYIDQLTDKDISILIPGAGNAYEAEYLFNSGFKNITILDIASSPIKYAKEKIALPCCNFVQQDFFDHNGKYDLILEQTFFCALEPRFRESYIKKTHQLLKDNGRLVGVLFNFENKLNGPPFGGIITEYIKLFESHFKIIIMESCYNSVKERQDKEIFIKLMKQK